MADAEELSLEETNRLRIQAGLAPLGEETEEVIDEDQVAYDNYQQLKEDRQREKNAKEVMERIEKAKNRQKATEKLKGKGLGDASDDDESAMKFIKKSRKREKELAEKRARELLEMDKGFEGVQYDSADLSGMKVAHDMAEFEDGGEVILTLKDRGILDEEDEDGIELTNVNLEERERLRKNQENKKKKPGYNVYDDEEFTIGGGSKNLLSQYDEELEGPKRTSFVIGQEGRVGQETPAEQKASIAQKLKAQDLSYEKMQEVKDYYTHEEAALTFKKPKKKKKVRRRVAQDDEDSVEIGTPVANVQQDNSDMAVDEPAAAAPVKKSFDEENFVDDDDLQQALARTRRIANKKKQQIQRFTPEDIARNIAQQRDAEQLENAQNDDEADSGLVISDTSEFVNSLSMDPVIEREKRERERAEAEAEAAAIVTEMQLDSEEDVDMENAESAEIKAHENGENEEEASTVVDEPLVSRGMAATLALLNQKGFIAKPTEDQVQREKHAASRLKWVAEQKRKDAQRERERERDRLRDKERDKGREGRGRDYEREREHEREVEKERKERERMKEYEQRMKDYKPDVNIEYTDEFGKVMTPKEAYRVLSHKFHGKTSGKAKTEKRIRKMQEELALNSMGSSDTPHNLAAAMIDRQEKTGSAHFVLSVGNRGVLPGDENNAAKKRKTE